MNKSINTMLYFLRCLYLLSALSPLGIIYLLKINNFCIAIIIFIIAFIFSYLFIYCKQQQSENIQGENVDECAEVEIAEPKYIPIYISYFVIALSIPYDSSNVEQSWVVFGVIYGLIFALILKSKFSYFNPYILLTYNFYEMIIKNNDNFATYRICFISRNKLNKIKKDNKLIRLNNFTLLESKHKGETT